MSMGKTLMKGAGRTYVEVLGKAGQLQECPFPLVATVERAPLTSSRRPTQGPLLPNLGLKRMLLEEGL